jgi:hypothetical protein
MGLFIDGLFSPMRCFIQVNFDVLGVSAILALLGYSSIQAMYVSNACSSSI